jgi:hypothetical protein
MSYSLIELQAIKFNLEKRISQNKMLKSVTENPNPSPLTDALILSDQRKLDEINLLLDKEMRKASKNV